METNYTLKRLKLIWPVFALFMFASLFVNAQQKAEILTLTINCEGRVMVKDVNTDQAVATILGPVTTQINVYAGQEVQFITDDEGAITQPNACLTPLTWYNGAGELLHEGHDLLGYGTAEDGITMTGDDLFITVNFGLATDEPYTIEPITNIQTIGGTPVIIPVTINYGSLEDSGCADDWVVDARITILDEDGDPIIPAGGKFLEVTFNGTPVAIDAADITDPTFLMSDVLGVTPASLAGHIGGSDTWTYTVLASPVFSTNVTSVAYTVEVEFVTYDPEEGCETFLAGEDFVITYRPVAFSATDPLGCAEEELCFTITVTYPTIQNIGMKAGTGFENVDILNNLYLTGPFTAGMTVTISGWVNGSWTIPSNVNLSGFYLSQIIKNSVSAGTEYADQWNALKNTPAGTYELEICIDPIGLGATNFELSAVAQLDIAQFNALGVFQGYELEDFEYASDVATLTSDPIFVVEYQNSTGTPVWAVDNEDLVCGLTYELRARVTETPDGTPVPAGEWRVDLGGIPSGANVTFEDKTSPTTDVHVSSFGVYEFYWHIFDLTANQVACGTFGEMTVGFYPNVESSLSVTEANAKVCSLATVITRTRGIVTGGASNNLTTDEDYTLSNNWTVHKLTYVHGATTPWAYRPVADDGHGVPTITQVDSTNNFIFNASPRGDYGYGKYRIIYNTTLTGLDPHTKTLCSSTADTIFVELYWKPIADIVFTDYDVCEFGLYHATNNPIDPVILRGSLPKSVTYAAGTGVVVEPYVNGKGQWTQTAGPAVTYVENFGDLTKREIKFHVPTYGTYTFVWTVTNDADGIPCENPAVKEYTIVFPEPAMANVNTSDLIYCFTQVKWESYMDVITGTNAYVNPWFTGAANTADRIKINKNWVTNYNGNKLQLNATKSAGSDGAWTVTDGDPNHVKFVLPATAGGTIDPRVAATFTTTGALAAGNAVAVFLHPGVYELTWTVTSDCDTDSDSFVVEFLASPEPVKIMEVTAGGEIVPPRPVCVGEPVHYILRRTTTNLDPVPGDNDVIWTVPDNFEVLATGGGAGIKQYWVKGVWTDEVAGAHFEVEEFGHPIHGCSTVNKFDPVQYKPSLPEDLVITGPTVVADGAEVEYSIPAKGADDPAVTYVWTATGATSMTGQGTNAVKVVWNAAAASRTLKVELSGTGYCNSPQVVGPITVSVERGSLAGQIKYFNNVETAMPTPFNTEYGGLTPDYFYVELWLADEDGPVSMLHRVAADYNLEQDLEAYFEFDDLDPNAHYVLRVLDGGFYYLDVPVADPQLRYTYTWNKWGGVNATDAVAIAQMHLEMDVNASWPWVGPEDEDYGFFSTKIADVNSSGIVGLDDAIWAMRRFVNPTQTFPNNTPNFRVAGRFVDALPEVTFPEWVGHRENDLVFNFVRFDNATYQFTSNATKLGYISEPFMLEDFDHFINVYYVATGDVSSSYVPTPIGQKDDVMTKLSLVPSGLTIDAQVGDIVRIPVTLDRSAQIGAMAIGLNFNTSYVEVVENEFEMLNNHDLMFIDNNAGAVRFASLFPETGSNVAVIPVRIKADFEGQIFTLDSESSMAGIDRTEMEATMNVDAVSTKSATGIEDPAIANLRIGNFPNPFTTTTTIEYTLPEAGQVTLAVYNNVGQLVTTLVSEAKEAGLHQVVLNRSDVNGDGMYIYRIYVEAASRSYTATGNVVLMK